MNTAQVSQKLVALGIVGVVVSVAVLAVNPFQPRNFRSTPEDLRSPVVVDVWLGLKDLGRATPLTILAMRSKPRWVLNTTTQSALTIIGIPDSNGSKQLRFGL